MKTNIRTDRACYIAVCITLLISAAVFLVLHAAGITILDKIPPCLFHTLTGYDCPGCGGTRAVAALLQGRFLQSFFYHPIVPYTAAIVGWFFFSQTVERLTLGRLHIGMHYRNIYLWIALGIVIVRFLLWNLY